jgi:HprK-related kinase A
MPTLADSALASIKAALAAQGLWLDLGASTLRLRGRAPALAAQLQAAYGRYPFVTQPQWSDLQVAVEPSAGMRRWMKPQVVFQCDGAQPFDPFPADHALPLLEWGSNWMLANRMSHLLLLHAGVVERNGGALIMPALPGSGKSTLTAALSLSGWRLLSDEFGAFDPALRQFRAVLKPVALKNQSIAVIRAFSPQARFGPEFPKTRKGTVAHLAATEDAVARRHETAVPRAVVLPQWREGSPTRLERVAPKDVFGALAFNAFNYKLLGEVGFDGVLHLARHCAAYQLIYSDLHDALRAIDAMWRELPS